MTNSKTSRPRKQSKTSEKKSAAQSPQVIGMIHLHPLIGAPISKKASSSRSIMTQVLDAAQFDAEALLAGGVHALMIENFGDTPFFPGRNPGHVIAAMSRVASTLRTMTDKPIGINVLRNDGISALAIAASCDCQFVRINILSGGRLTDQGIIMGEAHEILRYRTNLGAEHIQIMADLRVKHSVAIGQEAPLEQEIDDLYERAMADIIVISGSGTGKQVNLDHLKMVRAVAKTRKIFIGSGANIENLPSLVPFVDGFIVGTALKNKGHVDQPVSRERVAAFMHKLRITDVAHGD